MDGWCGSPVLCGTGNPESAERLRTKKNLDAGRKPSAGIAVDGQLSGIGVLATALIIL